MRICIPIRSSNLEKAKKQVKRAEKAARGLRDVFLEIWLDKIGERIEGLGYRRPIIAVCRGPIEHGQFKGSEKERVKRLENAVAAGAKFVDIGIHTHPSFIKNLKKICRQKHAALIISKHFWNSTPSLIDLIKTCKRAKKLGADIVKIATFVKYWSDNVTLFELTKCLAGDGKKVIVIGMGEKGRISRIGCPLLGSYLMYVARNKESKTAPGQLILLDILHKLVINMNYGS